MARTSVTASVLSGILLFWSSRHHTDLEIARFWWRDTRLTETRSLGIPPLQSTFAAYEFPYPISFLPVPSHGPLSYHHMLSTVIPAARCARMMRINAPIITPSDANDLNMCLEGSEEERTISIESDGLLLYCAEASYEPGTSPLSLWIPSHKQDGSTDEEPLNLLES